MASLFGQYLAIYSNENLPKILENAKFFEFQCALKMQIFEKGQK